MLPNCSRYPLTTVRNWLRKGVIKGTKVGSGRLWRISDTTIDEFVKAAQVGQKQI
jgi:excisionase family DNA binding protein